MGGDLNDPGLSLTDALAAVSKHGGHVERSETWLLATGHEVLGPWEPLIHPGSGLHDQ